jgi:2-polyprenyl-3-methyl-5-hydroxy-6-metoxy-1,4-benzoquinol methylase
MGKRNSRSLKREEIAQHYASGYEEYRLNTLSGKLESERTRDFLKRFLPSVPAIILDVGGGPGAHACWLAKQGYEVHLIDITPLHVELASQASLRSRRPRSRAWASEMPAHYPGMPRQSMRFYSSDRSTI